MSARRKNPVEIEQIEAHACTLDVRLQVLRQVPFFDALSDDEIQRVDRRFREHGFVAGKPIYHAGDRAAFVYVVAVGKVTLARTTLEGQQVLLDVLSPGDFFGNLSPLESAVYADSATAHTAVCALAVSTEAFREIIAAYPSVALAVLDAVAARLAMAHALVHQISAHSAEQRVAFTLLRLADKLGQPHEVGLLIQMPLSREDVAGMAGTTTETASRVLSKFRTEGWIDSGRRWIAIRARESLQALIDGDS